MGLSPRFVDPWLQRAYEQAVEQFRDLPDLPTGTGHLQWGGSAATAAYRKGRAGLTLRAAGIPRGTIVHACWAAGRAARTQMHDGPGSRSDRGRVGPAGGEAGATPRRRS